MPNKKRQGHWRERTGRAITPTAHVEQREFLFTNAMSAVVTDDAAATVVMERPLVEHEAASAALAELDEIVEEYRMPSVAEMSVEVEDVEIVELRADDSPDDEPFLAEAVLPKELPVEVISEEIVELRREEDSLENTEETRDVVREPVRPLNEALQPSEKAEQPLNQASSRPSRPRGIFSMNILSGLGSLRMRKRDGDAPRMELPKQRFRPSYELWGGVKEPSRARVSRFSLRAPTRASLGGFGNGLFL